MPIFAASTDESRDHYQVAQHILTGANRSGLHLGLSGQIIREYLVVATRPVDANGLGLDPADALTNVGEFRSRTVFYDETEAVSDILRKLIRDHELKGTRIHDANVVAAMRVHGLSKLITDNPADFSPFADMQTVDLEHAAKAMRTKEAE